MRVRSCLEGLGLLGTLDKAKIEVAGRLDAGRRSALGQFMTPATVSRFMASLFPESGHHICRLLDPGAGMGSLTSAFLERWEVGGFGFDRVYVVAFEIDEVLRGCLEGNLAKYAERLAVSSSIHTCDFIEAAVNSLTGDMFGQEFPPFTHAILNPPYRKISTHSRHRMLLRRVGIETVNLYSAFVALALGMLGPGGHLVAIIPRSFCNGPYYRPFREFVFERAAIRRLHLFEARDKAFKDDDVLQENIIVHLERGSIQGEVLISTSTDDRFHDCALHAHPFDKIVFPNDPEKFIHVPTTPESNIVELCTAFQYSLSDLDIQVSTGPVVDFRVRTHIREMPENGTVPLLYPCHFASKKVEWPKPEGRKPNAILRNQDTEKWLYPNGFYTVVRRFSAKEERRRIMASVVCPSALDAPMLGFENHLNVFHCHKRGLPEQLAWGLAAFLNSTAVDNAFRRFNGHTQVNATDLRMMKYPSREILTRLGRWAMAQDELTQAVIDIRLGSIA
jgi:tRNA1(Val) A37 N6-methylase TrmN6